MAWSSGGTALGPGLRKTPELSWMAIKHDTSKAWGWGTGGKCNEAVRAGESPENPGGFFPFLCSYLKERVKCRHSPQVNPVLWRSTHNTVEYCVPGCSEGSGVFRYAGRRAAHDPSILLLRKFLGIIHRMASPQAMLCLLSVSSNATSALQSELISPANQRTRVITALSEHKWKCCLD